MTQEDKNKKYKRLLKELSLARKQANGKRLSEHEFYVDQVEEDAKPFDKMLFRAILEQAEGLSLTFNKQYAFQLEENEEKRLSREAYDTLDKAAILRPTRLGPLTLIG